MNFSSLPRHLIPVLVSIFFCVGCTPPSDPMLDLIDTDLMKTRVDDLPKTMDFIFSDRRYDQKEFQSRVATGLNRWTTYSEEKIESVEWQLDSLAEPLLEKYADLAILNQTDDLSFADADAYYVQESAWLKKIVRRVTESEQVNIFELYRLAADDYRREPDDEQPVADIVGSLNDGLNDDQAKQLADVLKTFDWIIRNIQLLPPTEPTDEEIEDQRLNDAETPAAAGVRGAGYQRYPWQTLLYGRGDAIDRAKVFVRALEQLEIPSLVLAIQNDDGPPQPWAVAVPVADKYFLFDAKLGLPIPGMKTGSIATFSEINENPELLQNLDLNVKESLREQTDYWVKEEDLGNLVGLVYIAPESFAKRMKVLESNLVDEYKIPLATAPSDLFDRLPKIPGVEQEIWEIGFRTHQFRQAVREALEDTENNVIANRLKWHFQNEAYIDDFTRYRTGRARFFVGKFESPRNAISYNAIESFEHLMYDDDIINGLAVDTKLQKQLGILQEEGANVADFSARLRSVQAQMRLVRRDAGLFLAQSHFDNGSVSAASNWLKLLREKEDAERWQDGIDYLLGRALEARKEHDLAIEQYRDAQDSAQFHGNLIRARILSELLEEKTSTDDSEQD